MNGKRHVLGKAPFIRKADLTRETTSGFMLDVIIALIPLILFAWVKNGILPFVDKNTNIWGMLYPLILPLAGGAFSVLFEYLWYKFIVTNKPVKERMATSYAVIPGLMLGMIVPISTPIWVLFIGVIFATVIAKLMFGGFGYNIFNPALIGFLFLTTYSYSGVMGGATAWGSNGFLNPSEVGTIVSGATPMAEFASNRFAGVATLIEQYGLLNMFFGFTPGALAETSAFLCLVALVYLLVRKVINWRIPVIYIGTVFVLTYIIGAFNGYAGTLDYALFGIFNGGLMFGAVFMATEPVTSPRNPNGRIIYGLSLGILTVVFRFASKMPEGVAVSILTLNMFTAIIERVATKLRVEPNKNKVVLTYSLIGLLLLGIASFPVVKSIPAAVVAPQYEYVSNEQDYKTFNFIYKFSAGDEEFSVTTDHSFKILSVSNNEFNTDEAKAVLSEMINSNKIVNYILSAEESATALVLKVRTKGYTTNPVVSTITYDNDNKIVDFSVTYDETYSLEFNDKWSEANGYPKDVLPSQIIDKQDNLDSIDVIAGATVTSKAVLRSVDVAKGYLDYLDTITELTLLGKNQDLETLEFVYTFRNADGKLLVRTNTNHEITSTVDEGIKAEVEAFIEKNKFVNYIESVTTDKIVVKTDGYGTNPLITSTFTFDNEFKITGVTITYEESYDVEYNNKWSSANGYPKDVLPGQIVDHQDDLDEVEIIAGATVTSKAIIKAAEIAKSYLRNLEGTNE